MIFYVEPPFMIYLHLYIFLGEIFTQTFCPFFSSFCFLIVDFKKFFIYFEYQKYILNYFLPVCGLSFNSLNNIFHKIKVLLSMMYSLLIILSWIMPLVFHLTSHHHIKDCLDFSLCYLLRCL